MSHFENLMIGFKIYEVGNQIQSKHFHEVPAPLPLDIPILGERKKVSTVSRITHKHNDQTPNEKKYNHINTISIKELKAYNTRVLIPFHSPTYRTQSNTWRKKRDI